MKKDKTIYILGAGFSADAGCPVTMGFTDKKVLSKVRRKLENKLDIKRFKLITKFNNSRIKDGYCEDDIESILNHVAAARYFNIGSTIEKKRIYYAQNIFTDLQWYIVKILEKTTKKIIPKTYPDFLKNVSDKDVIITFNYDLILERVLKDLGRNYCYGLNSKKKGIRILKLHGSVNWIYCGKCGPASVRNKYVALRIYSKSEKCPTCSSKQVQPIIIPPVLYKDSFYQSLKGGNWIQELWMNAYEELTQANNIVFIGFSMRETDTYAQELFKITSNVGDANYLIVNRTIYDEDNEESVEKIYSSVLVDKEIEFKEMEFKDYVKNISG